MDFLRETSFLLDFCRGLLVNLGPVELNLTQFYNIMPYFQNNSYISSAINRDLVIEEDSAINQSSNGNEEAVVLNSAEYEGGYSEDEPKARVEIWLPLSSTVEKQDYSEAVDETVWDTLNFGEELTQSQKCELLTLLKNHVEVLPIENNRLGFCPSVEHNIETGDAAPIKERLGRFSFWQQNEIAKQVTELLETGVISPCESEWAANVSLVRKKYGSIRMVLDSRDLNRATIKDRYQMGDIQNILDSVFGGQIFPNMDLSSG